MQAFANFLLDIGLLTLPLLYVKFIEKKGISLPEFGFSSKGIFNDMRLSAKIFIVLLATSFALSALFYFSGIGDFGNVESTVQGIFSISPFVAGYFLIVRVFAEEFFFRAFLVPRVGVILSSIFFGLVHLGYGSVGEAIGAAVLGGILAIAYNEKRQIVPNFVAHFLYNAFAVMMILSY